MLMIIKETKKEVANWVADYIAKRITIRYESKKHFVLGLPTGSSPILVYDQLIELKRTGKVNFRNVVTFNMDEYIGLPTWDKESYRSYMWDNFFSHVDLNPENINLLNGDAEDLNKECADYENKIKDAGGIDLFLAGLGPDGHIAFNEPISSLSSATHEVNLAFETIVANSRFFNHNIDRVPRKALTVGVKTILDASEVILLVTGHAKAYALHKIIEDGVNHMWTGSALQLHPRCIVVCDEEATLELKVKTVKYFKRLENEIMNDL